MTPEAVSPTISTYETKVVEDRLILYADLLGVKEAAKRWSPDDANTLISLLDQIASLGGPGKLVKDGGSLGIPPAVTTFSDHIVLSYPMSLQTDIPKILPGFPEEMGCLLMLMSMRTEIARLARSALEIGLLVRGALTIGKLCHPGHLGSGPIKYLVS